MVLSAPISFCTFVSMATSRSSKPVEQWVREGVCVRDLFKSCERVCNGRYYDLVRGLVGIRLLGSVREEVAVAITFDDSGEVLGDAGGAVLRQGRPLSQLDLLC